MRRIPQLLLVLSLLLLAACATQERSRSLTTTLSAYAGTLRWGEFASAAQFIDPKIRAEHPLSELDRARYKQVRVTEYDDGSGPVPLGPTEVPVDVTGRVVVIVDDVLYTGRTARSALDALTELGRPRAVQLAVLVDRGHRELPIRADFVGKNLPTAETEDVRVRLAEVDGGTDGIEIWGPEGGATGSAGL